MPTYTERELEARESYRWNRIPGTHDDGSPLQAPAISILHYAGDGRFDDELDLMNIAEVTDLMAATTWSPGDGFRFPEPNPDRTRSRPASPVPEPRVRRGRRHLPSRPPIL